MMSVGKMSVLTVALIAGMFLSPLTQGAPAGDVNNNNNNNHYNNHYYHDYGHHKHHDYDGGDDLFGHVKSNKSDHQNHDYYHHLYHYGFTHHDHPNDTDYYSGGGGGGGGGNGIIKNIKKFFKNDAKTVSASTMASVVSVAVVIAFAYDP